MKRRRDSPPCSSVPATAVRASPRAGARRAVSAMLALSLDLEPAVIYPCPAGRAQTRPCWLAGQPSACRARQPTAEDVSADGGECVADGGECVADGGECGADGGECVSRRRR